MSMNSGIEFTAPILPKVSLRSDYQALSEINTILSNRELPSYPPLRLSQILQLIKNGSADAVTLMEWLSVFNDDFEQLEPERIDEACILLWEAIGESPRVARLALYMACNHVSGLQGKFPKCLIDTLYLVKDYLKGINKLRVIWLIALIDKDFVGCIRMSLEQTYSPLLYNTSLNMPPLGCFRELLVDALPAYVQSEWQHRHRASFIECLKSLTESEKVKFFDAVLLGDERTIYTFSDIIENECLPTSENTIWYKLHHLSREVLNYRYELGGYYVLKTIIDSICKADALAALGLTDKDAKQLKSRSAFWSNYSDGFNQTKLLLPILTAKTLGLENQGIGSDTIVMDDSEGNNAEVFVFELNKTIVVEVLRGVASEIRLFDLNERNQVRLLSDPNLTLIKIRKMSCDYVLDHVKLWQYFCEQTLRCDLKILPNTGTDSFKGLGRLFGRYSSLNGLPKPERDAVLDRLKQLEVWNEIFWQREARIKNVSVNEVRKPGAKELEFAKLNQLISNDTNYSSFIKQASELGNPEAMCAQAVKILNSKGKTFNQHREAEGLVHKALEAGYEKANHIIAAYKLKSPNSVAKLSSVLLDDVNKRVKPKQQRPSNTAAKTVSSTKSFKQRNMRSRGNK